jgi:hypothetical protein
VSEKDNSSQGLDEHLCGAAELRSVCDQQRSVAELLERVKAATGPDREIDRDLVERFYSEAVRPEWRSGDGWFHPDFGKVRPADPYTASLDAALALVERVLPGWAWSVGNLRNGAQCYLMDRPGGVLHEPGLAATPPLAVLRALLAALLSAPASCDHKAAQAARAAQTAVEGSRDEP